MTLVNLVFVAGNRLSRLQKVALASLAKRLGVRHGGQLSKNELIGNIVATPQPAVEYTYGEIKEMFFTRTGRRLRDSRKANMIVAMTRELPDFVVRKRDAMTGLDWFSFVVAVLDFVESNEAMVDANFKFKWWTIKADSGKFPDMNDQQKEMLRQDWQLVKMLPQFQFTVSQEEHDRIEEQLAR